MAQILHASRKTITSQAMLWVVVNRSKSLHTKKFLTTIVHWHKTTLNKAKQPLCPQHLKNKNANMSQCPILKRNEAQATPTVALQKWSRTIVTLVALIRPTNVAHAQVATVSQRNHRLQVQKAVALNHQNMAKNLRLKTRKKTKLQANHHLKTKRNLK